MTTNSDTVAVADSPRQLDFAVHRPHARPKVAVDTVLFAIETGRVKCYLVRLRRGSAAGKWAFPGGLVREGEMLDDAARRELSQSIGLEQCYLEQLFSF